MNRLLLISTLFLLFSCGGKGSVVEEIPFEFQNITASEKIKLGLSDTYLSKMELSRKDKDLLQSFYENRSNEPIWINDSMLTDFGLKMTELLNQPEQLAVLSNRVELEQGDNFLQDEFLLTTAYARFVNDLDSGMIDFELEELKSVEYPTIVRLENAIPNNETEDVRKEIISANVKDTSVSQLMFSLVDFHDDLKMDTSTFEVCSIKKDTLLALQRTEEALIQKGYLDVEKDLLDTLAFDNALKNFQEQNGLKPDGVIGKYTSKALNESTIQKRNRIILAIEKQKSKRIFPKKFIHVNIPEYTLRFFDDDTLVTQHRVVVGKWENQTPEFSGRLNRIVFYPYWNVPYSISSKEILPHAKRSSAYFAKHNYTVLRKGDTINPDSVNWSKYTDRTFPFKVIQGPGRRNSLGIVKFLFPNKYDVYFHDTPSKLLFETDVRAYSHGCIRTKNPVDLAKCILESELDPDDEDLFQEFSDTLDSVLFRQENYHFRLKRSIPVYIDYQTVYLKDDKLITAVDIYGRDEKYLKLMGKEE